MNREGNYRVFMRDVEKGLKRGESVYIYFEYQLREIMETYKDEGLRYEYSEKYEWWKCWLSKPKHNIVIVGAPKYETDGRRLSKGKKKARRPDITDELVRDMRERGYSIKEMSIKLKCSTSTIKRRLGLNND